MRPLIHVGYPKTASTWLQESVFSKRELGFLYSSSELRPLLVSEFILTNDYKFEGRKTRKVFSDYLQKNLDLGLRLVLSEETLMGNPCNRRYDSFRVAQRLRETFPEALILICVREQRDIALSFYRQYVSQLGPHNLEMFIGTGNEQTSFTSILRPDFLKYDQAVAHYRQLFGVENVLVLPIELLRRNQVEALSRLSAFHGRSFDGFEDATFANAGIKGATVAAKRLFNRFLVTDPLKPQWRQFPITGHITRTFDKLVPEKVHRKFELTFCDQISARYDGLFVESNRKLSDMAGYDFAKFGYMC